MNYGFIKACAVSPALRVADCPYNAQKTIEAMQQAAEDGCQLTVFPELGLTGYTCGDLFLQQPLLDAAEAALREILKASEALQLVALVGLPVTVDAKLYNCAAVICQGALLGLVPKSHIPNYGEFYEKRHYCAAPAGVKEISFAGQKTLFGTKLLFRCETMQAFTLAVEICEDLWAPLPPSTAHAPGGRYRACKPLGKRRDCRQGGIPPGAGKPAVGAASVRIFIRGRRARRVDDRHGLLGSQSDRGKRRASCRVQTVLTSACLHRAGPRKASCRAAAQYEL